MSPVTWEREGMKQASCDPTGGIFAATAGTFRNYQTEPFVPRARYPVLTATPIGLGNIRMWVFTYVPSERTAIRRPLWYVVMRGVRARSRSRGERFDVDTLLNGSASWARSGRSPRGEVRGAWAKSARARASVVASAGRTS